MAIVKSEQAEFDEGVEIGRKAVSLSPRHAPNVALYTVALGRAGNYQAALQQIKRAIRLSPIYPAWYLHVLGSCGFAVGEDEQAVSAYRACLEATDPESAFVPIVRVWLAICLASAGHGAEARKVSAEVLRLDPSFRIDDWWQFPRKDWALRERAVGIWNVIVSS